MEILQQLNGVGKKQNAYCSSYHGRIQKWFDKTIDQNHHQKIADVGPDELIMDEEGNEDFGDEKQQCWDGIKWRKFQNRMRHSDNFKG